MFIDKRSTLNNIFLSFRVVEIVGIRFRAYVDTHIIIAFLLCRVPSALVLHPRDNSLHLFIHHDTVESKVKKLITIGIGIGQFPLCFIRHGVLDRGVLYGDDFFKTNKLI